MFWVLVFTSSNVHGLITECVACRWNMPWRYVEAAGEHPTTFLQDDQVYIRYNPGIVHHNFRFQSEIIFRKFILKDISCFFGI
jgi:hypothetical protein